MILCRRLSLRLSLELFSIIGLSSNVENMRVIRCESSALVDHFAMPAQDMRSLEKRMQIDPTLSLAVQFQAGAFTLVIYLIAFVRWNKSVQSMPFASIM